MHLKPWDMQNIYAIILRFQIVGCLARYLNFLLNSQSYFIRTNRLRCIPNPKLVRRKFVSDHINLIKLVESFQEVFNRHDVDEILTMFSLTS